MAVQRFRLSFFALVTISAAASAQAPPDAGTLLQQIERNRAPPLPRPSVPLTPPPEPMKSLAGPVVTVTAFRFAGNTLIGADALSPAVAGFVGRPLSFTELQGAAAAVAEVYRKAGWIVRVYLPAQAIDGGVVTLQVVEAVFGQVRLDGPAPTRVGSDRLLATVRTAQPRGQFLNADALDRALLLIGDTPGISASGSLAAGQDPNETDLLLKLEDGPLFNGYVGADNYNSRSTGAARVTADVFVNSPLRLGDQLVANLIHSRGSDYARADYTVPIGSDGWRVGANASYLSYKLVADELAALDAKGTATTLGVEASYPVLRARLANVNLLLAYDNRRFDNRANGGTVTHYTVDDLSVGLAANLLDRIGGGGSNAGALTLTQGRVDLADSPSEAGDALTTRSAGSFTKLRYAASRTQLLSESVSLFAGLSGQAASKNLDSSEKFYLGGPYGVRAYPVNESGGSEGQLLTVEARKRLPANVDIAGFFDYGRVRVNRDNDFVGAAVRNSTSLKGAGLTVGWVASFGLSLKATWAHRIGSNPNPAPDGSDQDGSHTTNRVWLQASLPF